MNVQYVLKSRMYREELLRWSLILALLLWALTASVAYIRSEEKVILIGVSDEMTYLIQTSNKKLEAKEKLSFLTHFLGIYFSFDKSNYADRMSQSGDLMSEDLWALKNTEILKIKSNLETDPYSQKIQVLSIDDLGDGKIEVRARMTVNRKITSESVNIKINLKVGTRTRNSNSPWPYEIQELSDETL